MARTGGHAAPAVRVQLRQRALDGVGRRGGADGGGGGGSSDLRRFQARLHG